MNLTAAIRALAQNIPAQPAPTPMDYSTVMGNYSPAPGTMDWMAAPTVPVSPQVVPVSPQIAPQGGALAMSPEDWQVAAQAKADKDLADQLAAITNNPVYTEARKRLEGNETDFATSLKNFSDNQAAARQQIEALDQAGPRKVVQPTLKQVAPLLILAALAGSEGGNLLGRTTQGFLQGQQQAQENNQNEYQRQMQALMQRNAMLNAAADDVIRREGINQNALNRLDQRVSSDKIVAEQMAGSKYSQIAKTYNERLRAQQNAINQATTLWNAKPTENDTADSVANRMKMARGMLVSAQAPGYAPPSDEEINQTAQAQMDVMRRNKVVTLIDGLAKKDPKDYHARQLDVANILSLYKQLPPTLKDPGLLNPLTDYGLQRASESKELQLTDAKIRRMQADSQALLAQAQKSRAQAKTAGGKDTAATWANRISSAKAVAEAAAENLRTWVQERNIGGFVDPAAYKDPEYIGLKQQVEAARKELARIKAEMEAGLSAVPKQGSRAPRPMAGSLGNGYAPVNPMQGGKISISPIGPTGNPYGRKNVKVRVTYK